MSIRGKYQDCQNEIAAIKQRIREAKGLIPRGPEIPSYKDWVLAAYLDEALAALRRADAFAGAEIEQIDDEAKKDTEAA